MYTYMATQVFINLPIKDLEKSKAFFTALGYTFHPQFTDEKAGCLVIEEGNIYSMLIMEDFFKTFLPKTEIADAHRVTETLVALTCESREAVDSMLAKGLAAGGTEPRPAQDHGFMYVRALQDLDGHIWEYFWMDEKAGVESTQI